MNSALNSSRDVIIRTPDYAAATKFYESVLGLPVVHRGEVLMGFETGSFCLYVEKGEEHGPVFEFLARDIEAQREKLVSAGCAIQEEDASVRRCYMRDPYGLVFNIGQADLEEDSR